MKKILVPTDFSPTAEKAFRFAVNLALKNSAIVVLYHVYTPVESSFIDTEDKRQMYNIRVQKNTLKRLQRLKKKVIGVNEAIPVQTIVDRSPLTDNILDFARHNAIDLIVLGTQGASGLKKVIIGSEAARIAEASDVPVLLIPERFEWNEPDSIVFTTNYALSDWYALDFCVELAQLFNARLTVVRLLTPGTTEGLQDKELGVFETYAEHVKKSFSNFPLQFNPILTDSVQETMENLHKEVSYDILCMVRSEKSFLQRLFLKSFTKAMCYVTTYPLLILPADFLSNQKQFTHSNNKHEKLHHSI